ncbi:MAG: urea transporter [Bacteroidota bacterium]|nr:urea transporter [Bacteroidota bacterium]
MKNIMSIFIRGIFNSYSDILFSNKLLLSVSLLVVSFFDPFAGTSGLISILVSNLTAYIMGYNENSIRWGTYGFNSLFVGLALGNAFNPGPEFFLLLIFASMLTFFVTVAIEGVLYKYGLPFLSLPFMVSVWIILLASRQFSAIELSERGIYHLNSLYYIGGKVLISKYTLINNIYIPLSIKVYLVSLGAIFFQFSVVAGLIVAIALLITSRISFVLSLLGFYSAWYFYKFIGADISVLSYNYIGFNFILTAIAIGGIFIIPSFQSFCWVLMLTPMIVIVSVATSGMLSGLQLPVYSIPFNVIVLLFLYIIKFRTKFKLRIQPVIYQLNSPEKNLYSYQISKKRFEKSIYFPLSLPFWGEWNVSQGHNSKFTHGGDWKHAWDFNIVNEKGKSFRGKGNHCEDYYCYAKPVIAPADGYIEETVEYIEDNKIGEVNMINNWGNTIIIKHAPRLYTKLSHLKPWSLLYHKGDFVRKGEIIGYCGNTGRSPEPHLHFQIQSTPHIGSKTIDHFIASYIVNNNQNYELKYYDKPLENQKVSNIVINNLIYNAFHFIPGKELNFNVYYHFLNKSEKIKWEVMTDYYNKSYIYCHKTKAKAYFNNDGYIHYFNYFEGSHKSLLFCFFLAFYKVQLGFYDDLIIKDIFPVNLVANSIALFFHDFVAPFWTFIKTDYTLKYKSIDNSYDTQTICLESEINANNGFMKKEKLSFKAVLADNSINKVEMYKGNELILTVHNN